MALAIQTDATRIATLDENVNPREVNRKVGAVIDASGELPSGQAFKDVTGLKKILVERKGQFTRTLTERLLGYACGRRIEPGDRREVNPALSQNSADEAMDSRTWWSWWS